MPQSSSFVMVEKDISGRNGRSTVIQPVIMAIPRRAAATLTCSFQKRRGHCPNCNEDGHTAFSKLCALYRREEEILLIMYRQGITKGKARKLLADTGRYADIVYARRFAQGANSLVPSHQHHQQRQQQQQQQQQRRQQ